ncbi:MAG: hypothetical protein N2053_01430 [Chitinispirillaceae bacterium]|nr:hypothetical protein [Chitinispirillaceae bacterium]
MKKREKKFCLIGIIFLIITQCTVNRAHKEFSDTESKECSPLIVSEGDTLSYTVFFSDSADRRRFIGSLSSFLKKYPFSNVKYDSVNSVVCIKLAPFDEKEIRTELSPLEIPRFTESITEKKDTTIRKGVEETFLLPEEEDTIIPESGGTIKIWSERKELDEVFFQLISEDPFSSVDTIEPLFEVNTASEKKISLQIKKKIYDNKGKVISVLDIIDSWTEYIKNYPAEGLSLFRYVEGIKEFVEGKEVTIRGISALDQKTIVLRLSKADDLAIDRMKNIRLNGGVYSKVSVYSPVSLQKEQMIFIPKVKGERRSLLDTLIISFEEDKNPLLSYSLKKYSGVIISNLNDLNYAKTTLQKNSNLYNLTKERYFIACKMGFEEIGKLIASKVNREELLKSTIMAEGEIISAIESDFYEDTIVTKPSGNISYNSFFVGKKIKIICRKDDLFSIKIGEKILAILLSFGISSELLSLDPLSYQRALVSRNYECAVGWVSENVKNTLSERLRLATIWFEDKNDEKERIATFTEIPLFSVTRYLLLRKPAGLYRGHIKGLYASYKRK